jgi:phosphate transport system substrate-binding protein
MKPGMHSLRKNLSLPLAMLLLLFALCSCSSTNRGDTTQPPAGGRVIRGAGATFPSLLYKKWFGIYQSQHPETGITYDAVGSEEGIKRFIGKDVDEGKVVDFGASDAAMTDQQINQVPGGVLMIPATASSVVLVYNLPGFDGDLKLSREAYAGIFSGEIQNWNDSRIAATNPQGHLPDLTIARVVRQEGSGTTFVFTSHLSAIDESWRNRYGAATNIDWPGNPMRAKGNEGVAARVQQSIGAIGYVGYEFGRKLGLKMALLENKSGNFVRPSQASGAAALSEARLPQNLRVFVPDPSGPDTYPLVTFSWILLRRNYEDAAKGNAIRDLVRWCLQDGQQYAGELGYIPLPSDVTERDLQALSAVNSGL